jgi:hypothetical protein
MTSHRSIIFEFPWYIGTLHWHPNALYELEEVSAIRVSSGLG